MPARRYHPDPERLSVLLATIMLAYALTHIIRAPDYIFRMNLGETRLAIHLNISMAFSILAGGLAATGADWLLRGHPSIQPGETREHWLLPTLTALILGIALYALPSGANWWIAFGMSGLLLLAVFQAEFIVVDPEDAAYPLATAVLVALSYTLVLILSVAVRSAGLRLVLLAPAIFLTSGFSSLRVMHLRLNERWEFGWAVGIALITTQLGTSLQYWPITPVQFGLAVLGPLFALTSLAINLLNDLPSKKAWIESAILLVLTWGLAFLL